MRQKLKRPNKKPQELNLLLGVTRAKQLLKLQMVNNISLDSFSRKKLLLIYVLVC